MNIKKFIAIILTAVTCIMCIPVTASAVTTTDLGYRIVNSTAKVNKRNEVDIHKRWTDGRGIMKEQQKWIVVTTDVTGISGNLLVNQDIVSMGSSDYVAVCAQYSPDGYDFKCYFRAESETKWHLFKNYVKITKPGNYQVRHTWHENDVLQEEVINFTVHKWVNIKPFYDGNLVGTSKITLTFNADEVPDGAKYYYTTNGKKPTTKSKQANIINELSSTSHNKFTFKKSCTFRMLITCPGYEDTYITIPIGISKEYANSLLWLNKDEDVDAYVTAATGVYNRPQSVEFCRGYDRTYEFYYTTDGSKPTTKSATIRNCVGYVDIDKTCTLRVLTIDKDGNKQYSRFKYIIDRNSAVYEFYQLW